MNSRHYHTPVTDSERKRCPICDKPVYSPAGIHPQCAIKQNESVVPEANPQADAPIAAVAVVPVSGHKPKPA